MDVVSGEGSNGGVAVARGFCTVCRKTSVCVCNRCGDYYCSPDCQRKDWRSHRYICFPMPSLVRAEVYDPYCEGDYSPETSVAAIVERKMHAVAKRSNNNYGNIISISSNGVEDNYKLAQQRHKNKFKKAASPGPVMPTSPYPRHNSRVILCGFRTPNRCHVRSANPEDIEGYLKVVKQIDSYGKTAPVLTKLPKPHTYAITSLDCVMYRVEILSARSATTVRVHFCDIGVTGVRQLTDLREITSEIVELQQYAVWVQLHGVLNYAISDELISFLSRFEDQEFFIKYDDGSNSSNVVELVNCETKHSLNRQVAEYCKNAAVYMDGEKRPQEYGETGDHNETNGSLEKVASPKQTENDFVLNSKRFGLEEPPVMVAPFATHLWKPNAVNFKVIILDNSCLNYGYFGCIAETDVDHLFKVQEYLNDYPDKEATYKPQLNEYCIAKFEDEWYRAKVIEVPDDKHFTVVYIDFTNESTLTSKDIRRYPDDLKGDCYTMLCLIDGLPDAIEDNLLDYLRSVVAYRSKFLIDKVKEVNQEIVVVECSSLMTKLKEEKLL